MPGGLSAQSARLVQAFDILRMEMRYVGDRQPAKKETTQPRRRRDGTDVEEADE